MVENELMSSQIYISQQDLGIKLFSLIQNLTALDKDLPTDISCFFAPRNNVDLGRELCSLASLLNGCNILGEDLNLEKGIRDLVKANGSPSLEKNGELSSSGWLVSTPNKFVYHHALSYLLDCQNISNCPVTGFGSIANLDMKEGEIFIGSVDLSFVIDRLKLIKGINLLNLDEEDSNNLNFAYMGENYSIAKKGSHLVCIKKNLDTTYTIIDPFNLLNEKPEDLHIILSVDDLNNYLNNNGILLGKSYSDFSSFVRKPILNG